MSDEPLCPRPINSAPDETTMAECILSGKCGCTAAGHEYAQKMRGAKISIRRIGAYRVTIDGKDCGVFTEASRWNGMVELRDSEGRSMIVDAPNRAIEALDSAFGKILGDESGMEATVVKLSPDLLPTASTT